MYYMLNAQPLGPNVMFNSQCSMFRIFRYVEDFLVYCCLDFREPREPQICFYAIRIQRCESMTKRIGFVLFVLYYYLLSNLFNWNERLSIFTYTIYTFNIELLLFNINQSKENHFVQHCCKKGVVCQCHELSRYWIGRQWNRMKENENDNDAK